MLNLLLDYHQNILQGIGITVLLLVVTVSFGLILSIIFAAIKYFRLPILAPFINLFIFIIRGTPFLVQLFIIYYGPLQFNSFINSPFAPLFKSAFFCALLALILNTTAYTTCLFYGAINNLPKADIRSGEVLALNKTQIFIYIILPRFFVRILPAYTNEVIMILKCTSLVSTISILDLMGVIKQTMAVTYQTINCLAIAGIIYLLITMVISFIFKKIYKRYYCT